MKPSNNPLMRLINNSSLVSQIVVGLLLGILVAWLVPAQAKLAGLLGSLFVGGLKAVAPVLVFILVTASIAGHK